MKRFLGAGLLGLAMLGTPVGTVWADDVEGEPEMAEESGSGRNLVLAAILAVVVIGGGYALSRRS